MEVNLLTRYPRSNRPVAERGMSITDEHRKVARQFGREFFDGDRLYGYGGYNYHPKYWVKVIYDMIRYYGLTIRSIILDVGCAKGFMLHDFADLLPNSTCAGVDISRYAIGKAMPDLRLDLKMGSADDLRYRDNSFDLVVSINTIHNLPLERCKAAIQEIERVSRGNSYIVVDAWRNDAQRELMRQWNLTALTSMHVDDWTKLFNECGYTGDYWWFTLEE